MKDCKCDPRDRWFRRGASGSLVLVEVKPDYNRAGVGRHGAAGSNAFQCGMDCRGPASECRSGPVKFDCRQVDSGCRAS